jgi:hypothetical protein
MPASKNPKPAALRADVVLAREHAPQAIERLRDLNAAIRWMRDPAPETALNPRRKD